MKRKLGWAKCWLVAMAGTAVAATTETNLPRAESGTPAVVPAQTPQSGGVATPPSPRRKLRGFVPAAAEGAKVDAITFLGLPPPAVANVVADLTKRNVQADPAVSGRRVDVDGASLSRQAAVELLVEACNHAGMIFVEVDAGTLRLVDDPEAADPVVTKNPPSETELRERKKQIEAELERRRAARARGELPALSPRTQKSVSEVPERTTVSDLLAQVRRQAVLDDLHRRRAARDEAVPGSSGKPVSPNRGPGSIGFALVDCPLGDLAPVLQQLRGKPIVFAPELGGLPITVRGENLTSAETAETLFAAFRKSGIEIEEQPGRLQLSRLPK